MSSSSFPRWISSDSIRQTQNRAVMSTTHFIFICVIVTVLAKTEYFSLINPQTGFALDVNDEDFIVLQEFSGTERQQWSLEYERGGKVFIVNKAMSKVMDIDYRWHVSNSYVVMRNKYGTETTCPKTNSASAGTINTDACQKWYIQFGGNIVNACGDYAFAIDTKSNKTNVKVETVGLGSQGGQKFVFKYL